MNILNTYEKLEELGRVRLSKNFFMRDFLYGGFKYEAQQR